MQKGEFESELSRKEQIAAAKAGVRSKQFERLLGEMTAVVALRKPAKPKPAAAQDPAPQAVKPQPPPTTTVPAPHRRRDGDGFEVDKTKLVSTAISFLRISPLLLKAKNRFCRMLVMVA